MSISFVLPYYYIRAICSNIVIVLEALKYTYFLYLFSFLIYFYCIDIFKLFFSDNIILNILTITNPKHPNFSEKPYFHPITLI